MRLAARAARNRRCSVGSSSTARTSSLRAERFASRASVRRPAFSSAAAARACELGRDDAVELLVQGCRLVEVVGTDLDELLACGLVQPVRHL